MTVLKTFLKFFIYAIVSVGVSLFALYQKIKQKYPIATPCFIIALLLHALLFINLTIKDSKTSVNVDKTTLTLNTIQLSPPPPPQKKKPKKPIKKKAVNPKLVKKEKEKPVLKKEEPKK